MSDAEAARSGDPHQCPMFDQIKPHKGGELGPGAATVWVGGAPAAVAGTPCRCMSPLPNAVAGGSATVFIADRPAARKGDLTAHGGTITGGDPSVRIG